MSILISRQNVETWFAFRDLELARKANRGVPVLVQDGAAVADPEDLDERTSGWISVAEAIDVTGQIGEILKRPHGAFPRGPWRRGFHTRLQLALPQMVEDQDDRMFLDVFSVPEWWQIACVLGFGGRNDCPSPTHHSAMWRWLGENFGAMIACVGHEVVEFTVERPPMKRSECVSLAKVFFDYCPDIVDQGTETIDELASQLRGSRFWYFWWD